MPLNSLQETKTLTNLGQARSACVAFGPKSSNHLIESPLLVGISERWWRPLGAICDGERGGTHARRGRGRGLWGGAAGMWAVPILPGGGWGRGRDFSIERAGGVPQNQVSWEGFGGLERGFDTLGAALARALMTGLNEPGPQ